MKKNNKGFTLAELLIVVAIIAVLTAIAIPVFTAQLEKSREATDLANLRSAYAECMAALIAGTDADVNGVTYTAASGNADATATKNVTLKQQQDDWQTTDAEVAGVSTSNIPSTGTVTVTCSGDGSVTFSSN
ncbi:MAG: type II secretion system protein [Oscillospiraceae bacterium]|nr:type II secretion system protein [Oscillospiraceae bacterium]